jgi:hypothetical protein
MKKTLVTLGHPRHDGRAYTLVSAPVAFARNKRAQTCHAAFFWCKTCPCHEHRADALLG